MPYIPVYDGIQIKKIVYIFSNSKNCLVHNKNKVKVVNEIRLR